MPELPDLECYAAALRTRVVGEPVTGIRLGGPFVLRSVRPVPEKAVGRRVGAVSLLGKRLVFDLEGDLFILIHLMIAGRLHWRKPGASLGSRSALVALDFSSGSLVLTEAGSRRRAALHLVEGREGLAGFDRGGVDVRTCDAERFVSVLQRENHTLKRALTDPRLLAGIGNAYSDEILHRARLSPLALTRRLDRAAGERLYAACRQVLAEWTERLRLQAGEGFPEKVTAFRPEMAVHGKYGCPCPACGATVARIVYADNEANYCPTCQTGGRLLADRALSRLLKADWPRRPEDLEELLHPSTASRIPL